MNRASKILIISLLTLALMFAQVFADSSDSGFSGVKIANTGDSSLSIVPKTASGIGVAKEKATIAGVSTELYPGSAKLDVTYTGELDKGTSYIAILIKGGSAIPTYDSICAFEEHTVTAKDVENKSITFSLYPKLPAASTDMVLAIVSSDIAFSDKTVSFAYTVGK